MPARGGGKPTLQDGRHDGHHRGWNKLGSSTSDNHETVEFRGEVGRTGGSSEREDLAYLSGGFLLYEPPREQAGPACPGSRRR